VVTAVGVAVVAILAASAGGGAWQGCLGGLLPRMGHRNWIVVADAAYPLQSAAGIETLATGQGQIEVLKHVLEQVEAAPHVRAIVLLDAELDALSEKDAPGVAAYRDELKTLLKGKQVRSMPHEEIIAKLDGAARLFHILLLKTNMTLPYTSVFLELDCGYWTAEKEQRLRDSLRTKQ
jgi:D-ribose pyranose/furanose isomerase RbsD